MLSDLERRVIEHFKQMGLDDVLQDTAQRLEVEYGLPVSQGKAARWWAWAALSKGPTVLSRLFGDLSNLVTPQVTGALKSLLGPVQPAWVDIAGAAQIVYLAAHAAQAPGTFYLRGTGKASPTPAPLDWIATCYAARACGMAFDTFKTSDRPSLLMVMPVVARVDITTRLKQIGDALCERLKIAEPELWAEAGGDAPQPDPWAGDWNDVGGFASPAEAGDTQCGTDVIKYCVEKRTNEGRPVLLALTGVMAADQALLDAIRQTFGPVAFFFMGKDLAPPTYGQGPGLAADLPIQTADQAHAMWSNMEKKLALTP